MKRAILAMAFALLAAVSVADAKEVKRMVICGASDCRVLHGERVVMNLASPGAPVDRPAPGSDLYRVRLVFDAGPRDHTERGFAGPGAEAVRIFEGWTAISYSDLPDWRRAVRGLDPIHRARSRPVSGTDAARPRSAAPGEDAGGAPTALIGAGALALAGATWAGSRRLRRRQ